MSNKMTKKDYFNTLLTLEAVKADKGLTNFIQHELELLAKKNSADKKPTAQQVENEGIKDAILSFMTPNARYTITDFIKQVPACADLTNQRVSALVRQLVKEGEVERTEDKRKAYFSLSDVPCETLIVADPLND